MDIVERLQNGGSYDGDAILMDEAADEIKRLRKALFEIAKPFEPTEKMSLRDQFVLVLRCHQKIALDALKGKE